MHYIFSLLVSTSAIDCLERLVSEVTCYALNGTLHLARLLTFVLLNLQPLCNPNANPNLNSRL